MGDIQVHEFISVDGVVEDPRWTVDYPFDPKMGEAISTLMDETLHQRDIAGAIERLLVER